jgi:hypothetical protein
MNKTPVSYLWVAGVALLSALVLLGVMLFMAPSLIRWGLVGPFWYALLLLLGLSAALVVFGLFKSWARYKGKVFGGTLELGGPVVVMFLVVGLGFYLVPRPLAAFDVSVLLDGPDGQSVAADTPPAMLWVDLGSDRRAEALGAKGEVRLVSIPGTLMDTEAPVRLESSRYELAQSKILLNGQVQHVALRVKAVRFVGQVNDAAGQPLPGAHISIATRNADSDATGHFAMALPADLAEDEKSVLITAPGYAPYRAFIALGGNPLQVQLEKSR